MAENFKKVFKISKTALLEYFIKQEKGPFGMYMYYVQWKLCYKSSYVPGFSTRKLKNLLFRISVPFEIGDVLHVLLLLYNYDIRLDYVMCSNMCGLTSGRLRECSSLVGLQQLKCPHPITV